MVVTRDDSIAGMGGAIIIVKERGLKFNINPVNIEGSIT